MTATGAVPAEGTVGDPVRTGTVDGVRTVYAGGTGPVTGGLLFRVGYADETLTTHGITHLVEHLTLHRQGLTDVHHNGQTADTYTLFHATGTVDEVVEFLQQVTASLRDLSLDRLETEKEILRTEAAGRTNRATRAMRRWRFGAQGHGLAGYDELGLQRITRDDVRDWVARRFTRDNAVLFLTTDTIPDGLRLDLADGPVNPLPADGDVLPVTPAWFRGPSGTVMLDAVVARTTPATVFTQVAARALFRELRQEGGCSYTADCAYSPRDAGSATITLYADALPDKQGAVVGGMIDVLARLRTGRLDDAELESARAMVRKPYESAPDLAASMLPSAALRVLHGAQVPPVARTLAEISAVTAEDVRVVAQQVWDGALLALPEGGADWAGFEPAPCWSESSVEGAAYPLLGQDGVRLVVGPAGVSLTTPDGASTVLFSECVAMVAYGDGGRELVGRDGFHVAVEPTLCRNLPVQTIVREIDPRVRAEVVITRPARTEADLPRPKGPQATYRKGAARRPAPRNGPRHPDGTGIVAEIITRITTVLVCAGLGAFLGVMTLVGAVDTARSGGEGIWLLVALLGGATVLLGGLAWRNARALVRLFRH